MTTKQAKTIDHKQKNLVLAYIDERSPIPVADRLKVLLSVEAGLRVSEIAKLSIDAATDSAGRVAKDLTIFGNVGKGGRQRVIPMTAELREAIALFRKTYPGERHFAIGVVKHRQTSNGLAVWFGRLYRRLGFIGCSSHSGRRTFVTNLARRTSRFGMSLRDVQELAGHARLDTTQRYIEPNPSVRALVASLNDPRFETDVSCHVPHMPSRPTRHRQVQSLSRQQPMRFPPARGRAGQELQLTSCW